MGFGHTGNECGIRPHWKTVWLSATPEKSVGFGHTGKQCGIPPHRKRVWDSATPEKSVASGHTGNESQGAPSAARRRHGPTVPDHLRPGGAQRRLAASWSDHVRMCSACSVRAVARAGPQDRPAQMPLAPAISFRHLVIAISTPASRLFAHPGSAAAPARRCPGPLSSPHQHLERPRHRHVAPKPGRLCGRPPAGSLAPAPGTAAAPARQPATQFRSALVPRSTCRPDFSDSATIGHA